MMRFNKWIVEDLNQHRTKWFQSLMWDLGKKKHINKSLAILVKQLYVRAITTTINSQKVTPKKNEL
jgi:hypothetical protein